MQSFDELLVREEMRHRDKFHDGRRRPHFRQTGTKIGRTQVDNLGNTPDKFRKNLKNCLKRDVKTKLLQC